MKILAGLLLTFWLPCAFAQLLTVKEVQAEKFFDLLDYNNPKIHSQMAHLEERLLQTADLALSLDNEDPYFQENALIFIYAALYSDNILEASRKGVMAPIAAKDIKAKVEKILKYVERAKALRPDDIRMASWYYGMYAKHVDPNYVDKIIQLVEIRKDTFALISALTVAHEMKLTPAQDRIVGEMVEKFTSILSPCFAGKTKSQCHSTKLAPYAAQTGVVMMADYRLRKAFDEKSHRKQNIARVSAKVLYKSTGMVWMKDTTPNWMNKFIIQGRLNLTNKKNFTKENVEAYRSTPEAQVIFQCSSCHASPVN